MMTHGLGLKGLSRNIGATFARQVAAGLLGLIATVIVARVYGPEGNGALSVALLLPSMLATFLNLGVAPANVYFLGSKQIALRQLLAANVRIFLLFGTIGLLFGVAILSWKSGQFFPGVDPLILWFALAAFPLGLLSGYMASILQGLQQFRPYNILGIIQPAIFIVLVVGLTVLGNRELVFLVGAQIVASMIVLILTIRWLMPLVKAERTGDVADGVIKKILSYGWKAHLSNILAFVIYKADMFLVNLFMGPAAVGVYVIAVGLAEKLWLISQAVSTVLLPRLAQLSSDEAKRRQLTPLIARWVLIVTLLCALALAALADLLIALMFGADYRGALLPFWILLPGIVLLAASRVLANDLAARGRPELNMYTSIVVVTVNVIGNLVLIPNYGLSGAAAATTIAYTLDLILRLIIYGGFTRNRWHDSLFVRPRDFQMIRLAVRSLRSSR